jgi:hypothetical protein
MLDALMVFLQSDDISDGFFMAIIAAYDELGFDAHRKAPPGLHSGGMMQAILPEFADYPQLLHALVADFPAVLARLAHPQRPHCE